MESYEKEYVSKIKHRLRSEKSQKKKAEAVFLFITIAILALMIGYIIGSYYPITTTSDKDNVWSDSLKRYKEKQAPSVKKLK